MADDGDDRGARTRVAAHTVGLPKGVPVKPRRLVSYPLSLALVVAALVTLTGGWIAWWNYRSGLENTRTLAFDLFGTVARQTDEATEAFLAKAPPAAETLHNLALEEPRVGGGDPLAKRFVGALRANPSFTWISYSDAAGNFTGAFHPVAGDAAKIRVNQSEIVDGKTVLDEHDVAADGAWTVFRHEADTKYDPRTRPFYTKAVAAGGGTWTEPYVFFEKVPGITYARPLVDPGYATRCAAEHPGDAAACPASGALAGVFTVDFDLGRLSELARSLHPSEHGSVAIVASDGTVLAHPTAALVTADAKALVKVADVGDAALRAVVAAGAEGREVAVGGKAYLMRSVPISIPGAIAADGAHGADGGLAWRVVVYAPESDFTAALDARVVSSFIVSIIAVVIAVIVAWLLARRVSGPLTALAQDMAQVGEFRIDEARGGRSSLFREIEMMNRALAKMKGGLKSFGRFVPRDLVRTLLASGREAELAGELRTLTIYFSDIAGFTTLAESMKPDELVKFLGTYFEDTSNIIAAEKGTVDKYLGDGTMAFWGAPVEVPDHAARACAAALRCHRRVMELAAGGTAISARIGIATGEVLVGTIGSPDRMNYTVMGDTANLASRLEGLNKQYGSALMISEATFDLAAADVVARPVDVVAVKGKLRGVRVYELLAMRTDKDARAEAIARDSTRALDAYLARDFAGAIAAWDAVLAASPGDQVATLMRARAAAYVAEPPPADWTGVTVATSK